MITVQKLKIGIEENWVQATSWPNITVWSLSVPAEDSEGLEASAKNKKTTQRLKALRVICLYNNQTWKGWNYITSVKRNSVKWILGNPYSEIRCSCEKGGEEVPKYVENKLHDILQGENKQRHKTNVWEYII